MATSSFFQTFIIKDEDFDRFLEILNNSKPILIRNVESEFVTDKNEILKLLKNTLKHQEKNK